MLLQHRADANTPLHIAARVGSVEVAQVLLESRAKVNMTNMKKRTPLHLAALIGAAESRVCAAARNGILGPVGPNF